MSIAGKKSIYFTKKDLQDQRIPALAFKNIKFAHQAAAGETSINLLSLTTPASGMPPSFTQPNTSDLSSINLQLARNNIRLVSSLRGYLEFDSYNITGPSTIGLGFSTEEGETFVGIVESTPKTGLQVVDNDPVVVTGTLAAGSTEIIVGKPFDLNKYPTQQQGAILVFLDGQLLKRNVSNTQSAAGDGDYYEVDNGGTTAINIQINESSTEDRSYIITTNGLAAGAPSDSFLAQLQRLGGQIDAMIPTLAALAGVDTTDFQDTPNDIDLATFGGRVTDLEDNLAEGGDPVNGPVLATISTAGAVLKNKWQKKIIASNVSTNGTFAQFNGLQINKMYKYTMKLSVRVNNGANDAQIIASVSHDGSTIDSHDWVLRGGSGTGDNERLVISNSNIFVASASSLDFILSDASASSLVIGGATASYVMIEELNNYDEETTDFT